MMSGSLGLMPTRRILVLSVVCLALSGATEPAVRVQRSATTTDRFDLQSRPQSNLFHFLRDWALADAGEWPAFAPPITERDGWRDVLSVADREVWSAALGAFSPSRGRSLIFDRGILAVRDWSAGAIDRSAVPEADHELLDAIESALSVYERHWWPAHDSINRAWIDAVVPMLDEVEEAVVPRLEAAYGGSWPAGLVPVDVVTYANPVGAYSSGGRLTIAAGDSGNRMPQGVELVFHEASHVAPLQGPLMTLVEDAYSANGAEAPDRLWHDFIFFTAGEVLEITLEEMGRPGYEHYGAFGVYRRGERWTTELPAFERHWAPFLRSGTSDALARTRAADAIARELLSH